MKSLFILRKGRDFVSFQLIVLETQQSLQRVYCAGKLPGGEGTTEGAKMPGHLSTNLCWQWRWHWLPCVQAARCTSQPQNGLRWRVLEPALRPMVCDHAKGDVGGAVTVSAATGESIQTIRKALLMWKNRQDLTHWERWGRTAVACTRREAPHLETQDC